MKQKVYTLPALRLLVITAMAAIGFIGISQTAQAATFTVTSTSDSGAGSLRQAITDANNTSGIDEIQFNIAGVGPHTITLSSALPAVNEAAAINAASQPGTVCDGENTDIRVRINVNGMTNPLYFAPAADGSQVRGLAIANAAENAYALRVDSPNTLIRCNFFGTFDGMTTASTNPNSDWVQIGGNNPTVGGVTQASMNLSLASASSNHRFSFDNTVTSLIFRNNNIGVTLDGETSVGGGGRALTTNGPLTYAFITDNHIYSDNSLGAININNNTSGVEIASNTIGTTSDGSTAFTNTGPGILTVGTASNWLVDSNVIFASNGNSAGINFSGTVNNSTVSGNFVNVSADGNTAFSPDSGTIGIGANSATNLTIHSNTVFAPNQSISLYIVEDSAIYNNSIGLASNLTSCFDTVGIAIYVAVGTNNVIGSTTESLANNICAESGIYISDNASDDNSILINEINNGSSAIVYNIAPELYLNTPIIRSLSNTGVNTQLGFEFDAPAGQYRVDIYQNPSVLNGQSLPQMRKHFGHVTIDHTGSGLEQFEFSNIFPDLFDPGEEFLSLVATEVDASSDGYGVSSAVGRMNLEAAVSIETADNLDDVEEFTSSHTVTQTLTNNGPSKVSAITFNLLSSDCFSVQTVDTSGSATDPGQYETSGGGSYALGQYEWTGLLEPGQTLILEFNGPVTCGAGNNNQVSFSNEMVSPLTNELYSVNNTSSDIDSTDSTNIVGQVVDLEIVTEDYADPIISYDTVDMAMTDHQIMQTITNNGPATLDELRFNINQTCFNITGANLTGGATTLGTYDFNTNIWTGELAAQQSIQLEFYGQVDQNCGGNQGGTLTLDHSVNVILNNNSIITDSTSSNNDYSEDTTLEAPVVDLSVAKNLLNPQNYSPGQTLQYEIAITNNGPQDMRIDQLDGTQVGQNMLFLDIMPADITFVSFTSDDDIDCISFGPGSASFFNEAMENHSDHEIVNCVVNSNDKVITNGQTIRGTMTVQVANDSDMQFRNYVYAQFGFNDPEVSFFQTYDGASDLIDHIESQSWDMNNLARSVPVVDFTLNKELTGAGSIQEGDTVSYNLDIYNKGPMSINLVEYSQVPLIADIYPGDALSFESISEPGYACQDLGPGSVAFLGNAGMDHPNHQIVICFYTGTGPNSLDPDETISLTLNFSVNEDAPTTYTNYASVNTIPTDPDTQYLLNLFENAQSDVFDSINNENFSRTTYTAPASEIDTDGDGVPDVTEDTGPNNGDANNDGTPDSEQAHVTSFISSVTGEPTVLAVSEDCSIETVSTTAEAAHSSIDQRYQYPLGFIGFTLDCGTPGYTATISQYYYDRTNQDYVLRKYFTGDDLYQTISSGSIAQQSIAGRNVLVATYQVQDGTELDLDGQANGSITDPAGLGNQPTVTEQGSLPDTGENIRLMAMIAGVMLLVGLAAVVTYKKVHANEN